MRASQDIKRKSGSVVIPIGINREVNEMQPLNTLSLAIDVRPRGSKIDVNAESPSNVLEFKTVTCDAVKSAVSNEVHPANTDCPMVRTDEGRVNDSIEEHPESAPFPIFVSPEGRVSDVNDVQPTNEPSSIDRSPEGRVTDDREAQVLKVFSLMLVTSVGITIDIRAEPVNAAAPIFVTPEGIEIDVKLHLLKASSPMLKSPEGKITEVRDLQPLNELI